MSETKHTQGKWAIDGANPLKILPCNVSSSGNRLHIAKVKAHNDATMDEHLANARLIAKAPELLDWAEEFYAYASHCQKGCLNDSQLNELKQLILEAKGEKQ